MIFFSHKCGQLGNRLFAFAHLIAHAEAYRGRVANLSFDEYAQYFQSTSQDVWCRFPAQKNFFKSNRLRAWMFFVNRGVLKMLRKTSVLRSPIHQVFVADLPEYRFDESRFFELDTPAFQTVFSRKPVVFLFGRFFRDYSNFEKHQETIRNFFTPIHEIQVQIQSIIQNTKKETDLIVGVHMRRGDYEQFANGKYFYSQSEYLRQMQQLLTLTSSKRVKFIVCSNEPIQKNIFKDLAFCTGPGHLVGDMYTLAACDLIMGPPSTYTLWASFYGNKPLYQIRDLNKRFGLQDFVILPPELLYNFNLN